MGIVYTKHARQKFLDLKKLGIRLSPKIVEETVKNPELFGDQIDFPNFIASRQLDFNHDLRVVFRREGDTIVIITFYPAKRGRYL